MKHKDNNIEIYDSNIKNSMLLHYAHSLYKHLIENKYIDRLEKINQLGPIKVNSKDKKSRLDYIKLNLHLHSIVNSTNVKLKYTYGSKVSTENIKKDIKYLIPKEYKLSVYVILQYLVIICNIGHFHNTFVSSRAMIIAANKDDKVKEILLNASNDPEYKKLCILILEKKDYFLFHLLNSWLIIENIPHIENHLVVITKLLIRMYLNYKYNTDTEEIPYKVKYIFDIFKKIRNLSYISTDLNVLNAAITFNLDKTDDLKRILIEYLDIFNDNTPMENLMDSTIKLLSDYLYNTPYKGIYLYRLSKSISDNLIKQVNNNNISYFEDLFRDENSCLNRKQKVRNDISDKNILKITFNETEDAIFWNIVNKLEACHSVRIGWYARNKGRKTLLVALSKNIKKESLRKKSLKILKILLTALKYKPDQDIYNNRSILIIKFFLYYLFNERELNISADLNHCLVHYTRSRTNLKSNLENIITLYKENSTRLPDSNTNINAKIHEFKNILSKVTEDKRKDYIIAITGSIRCYRNEMNIDYEAEFDGLIIFPNRTSKQILFLEAKNTKRKSKAVKQLKSALEKFELSSSNIGIINNDAYAFITID